MRLLFLILTLAIAIQIQESFALSSEMVRPLTEAETVIAVVAEVRSLDALDNKLIMAVWGDGYAVWSSNHIEGGAPYYRGKVDPNQVAALLVRLERDGIFSDKELARANFGPDASYTSILVKSGKEQIKMRSWHEVFEKSGTLVARQEGITALNGRHRFAVLAEEDSDYLLYRLVWAETRDRLSSLLPKTGNPVDGKIVMKSAKMNWREESRE